MKNWLSSALILNNAVLAYEHAVACRPAEPSEAYLEQVDALLERLRMLLEDDIAQKQQALARLPQPEEVAEVIQGEGDPLPAKEAGAYSAEGHTFLKGQA